VIGCRTCTRSWFLVRVVERAIQITTQDIRVQEDLRTRKRQAALVARSASRTMNSWHLTGHAVDLVALGGDEVQLVVGGLFRHYRNQGCLSRLRRASGRSSVQFANVIFLRTRTARRKCLGSPKGRADLYRGKPWRHSLKCRSFGAAGTIPPPGRRQ
jgi:hypothetical protein